MYVIASDGGLLAEPVKVNELPMLMGERFEVLIDTRDGKAFDLITLPVSQMGMAIAPFDKPRPVLRIQPLTIQASGKLPDSLVSMPARRRWRADSAHAPAVDGSDAGYDGNAGADAKIW